MNTIDVVVRWGGTALAVERLAPGQSFTLGNAAAGDHHFVCDHTPAPRFRLVENAGAAGVRVRTAEGMSLVVDRQALPARDVVLDVRSRAAVRVGPLEILIGADRKAPTALDRMKDLVDARLLRLSGVALALHAAFVLMLLVTTSSTPVDDLPMPSLRPYLTSALHKDPPHVATRANPKVPIAEHARIAHARPQKAPSGKPSSMTQRDRDRATALAALADLGLGNGVAASNVFGAGFDTGLGSLRPSGASAAAGGGLGTRDTGGGSGGNSVNIGGLGLDGLHASNQRGAIDLLGSGHNPVRVRPEKLLYVGGMSREEIQRVMNRAMARIKYCYEKELNREPNLNGKLVMSFVIAGTGSVSTANVASDTMEGAGGRATGDCVTHVIERLQFPTPTGGGQVVVTYPFVFSTSGD